MYDSDHWFWACIGYTLLEVWLFENKYKIDETNNLLLVYKEKKIS